MSATSGRPVYIERYEVLNIINDAIAHNALSYEGCTNEIVESIARIPAADVRPVVKAEWYGEADGYADGELVYDMWSCPVCGKRFEEWEEKPDWNFCPNCGADMREES